MDVKKFALEETKKDRRLYMEYANREEDDDNNKIEQHKQQTVFAVKPKNELQFTVNKL